MVENNEASNEFFLTVTLKKAGNPSVRRKADTSIEVLKEEVARHMRLGVANIWIDPKVNEMIWKRGRTKAPRKIKVRVVKLQDETAEVILP